MSPEIDPSSSLESPAFQVFGVAALNNLPDKTKTKATIPQDYQELLDQFPSILVPDFQTVKHTVEHVIDTGDAKPIRTKARPLLPGSPKAQAGYAAWQDGGTMPEIKLFSRHLYRKLFLAFFSSNNSITRNTFSLSCFGGI